MAAAAIIATPAIGAKKDLGDMFFPSTDPQEGRFTHGLNPEDWWKLALEASCAPVLKLKAGFVNISISSALRGVLNGTSPLLYFSWFKMKKGASVKTWQSKN
jgi:hypothetical protein